MGTTEADATVHLGDGVVVIRRKGSSATSVSNVLGSEEVNGGRRVYLDRLVHKPFESELGGYKVSGAISTIMTIETPAVEGVLA